MKLRCKGCRKRIELAEYRCPFCKTVNFATDSELRAAYNANASRTAVRTVAAVVAVLSVIAVAIGVFSALNIIKVRQASIANYKMEFARVAECTGFEDANGLFNGRFELSRIRSESEYPDFELYIKYDGAPEDFIRESISLCDTLYRNVDCRDQYSFTVKCGDMAFVIIHCGSVETNVLFDYSVLETFKVQTLIIHTGGMTDAEKQSIESNNYAFEVHLK